MEGARSPIWDMCLSCRWQGECCVHRCCVGPPGLLQGPTRKTPHRAYANLVAGEAVSRRKPPPCRSTWAKGELHQRDLEPALGSPKSPLGASSSTNGCLMERGSGENLAAVGEEERPHIAWEEFGRWRSRGHPGAQPPAWGTGLCGGWRRPWLPAERFGV